MGKTLYGMFDSSAELYKEIQSLQLKGHDMDKITVIANRKDDLDFLNNPNDKANVEVVTNADEEPFFDKVKRFFLNEGPEDIRNRMGEMGVTDTETTAYINEVASGKYLLLNDAPTPEESKEERLAEDLENPVRTGVVNNPDPNLFPETTANAFPKNEIEAQPGKQDELHGNSANIFSEKKDNLNRTDDLEAKANSNEQFKQPKPEEYEGTIASDPHVDPFSADTKKALKASNDLNKTPGDHVLQDSDVNPDLEENYVENRINTDKL